MATIDIGKLTFTHKGDYAGGTAYVANDVVYYNGSAYIAKTSTTGNLPTSTAHWNTFTAGSGGIWNSGLSIGTAGQVVKVNSGASALEFGTVSSDYVKLATTSTASSSLNMDGYFSSDYKAYKILYDAYNTSSGTNLGFRAIHSGSVDTNNNYTYCGNYQYRNSGGTGSGDEHDWQGSRIKLGNGGGSNDKRTSGEITLLNPQDSNHKQMFSECTSWNDSGTQYCYNVYGTILTSAALTGFNLHFWGSGTFTPTYVNLYGIK